MGKYENTLKQVQIRNLLAEKKYDNALAMTESMLANNKVSDVSELKLYADIFRKCKKYDKAKELYYNIYEEIHTRRVLYNLIVLCIKSGSIAEAESLFKEYVLKDEDGIDRYILRYRIDKASDASRVVIINDLISINNCEYIEEWAYELAKQYHKAGMVDKCVEECHRIILWFGEGEIVERAKLLKMHHEGNVSDDVLVSLEQYIGDDVSKLMNSDDNGVEKTDDEASLEDEFKTQIQLPEESAIMAAKLAKENTENMSEYNKQLLESEYSDVTASIGADVKQIINENEQAVTDMNAAMQSIADDVSEQIAAEDPDMITQEDTREYTEEYYTQDNPQDYIQEKAQDYDYVQDNEQDAVMEGQQNEEQEKGADIRLSKYARDIPYMTEQELRSNPMTYAENSLSTVLVTVDSSGSVMPVVSFISKVIRKIGRLKNPKIAKIGADKLNTLDVEREILNLLGGCVLIENASNMSMKTVNSIIRLMDAYPGKIAIILSDLETDMSKMLFKEEILRNQIKHFVICK